MIIKAEYRKEGDAIPAVIEIDGVRFFSVPPKSKEDADRINASVGAFIRITEPPVESHTARLIALLKKQWPECADYDVFGDKDVKLYDAAQNVIDTITLADLISFSDAADDLSV